MMNMCRAKYDCLPVEHVCAILDMSTIIRLKGKSRIWGNLLHVIYASSSFFLILHGHRSFICFFDLDFAWIATSTKSVHFTRIAPPLLVVPGELKNAPLKGILGFFFSVGNSLFISPSVSLCT